MTNSLSRLLSVAFVLMACDAQAASKLALDFTGGEHANSIDDGMAGWRFRTNSAISVDALGLYDANGDGLRIAHQIGIWTDDGLLVTSTTISAGTASPLDGKFRFEPITPVTLPANETFRIAALWWPDRETMVTAFATVHTAPQISYLDRAYLLVASSFQFPSSFNSVSLAANFGTTFKFAVPEPTTLLAVVIGVSLVVATRRLR
jgi:hypothetical protein